MQDRSSSSAPARRTTAARVARAAGVVVAALGVLLAMPLGSGAQEDPSSSTTTTTAQGDGSTTTTTTQPTGGRSEPLTQPTGQVAYVTADGLVWLGNGDDPPAQVGEGAAIGYAQQGAVAVSPKADLLAWVRADGSLVTAPIAGGAPTVVASDVALDWLGREPVFAWDGTGETLVYLAKGTSEQVEPRDGRKRVLKDPNSFLVALPTGVLGNVVKTVGRDGTVTSVLGDPSLRSYIGVNVSLIDPISVMDSVVPGTDDRYTLFLGGGGGAGEGPSQLSADDPDIAPDGSFIVAVGPAKGHQELIRLDLDDLSETVLVVDERICNPLISPDATRIAYGGGENCDRLMLISSKGGSAYDITPSGLPDGANFGAAELGWTTDGRFLTLANCNTVAGEPTCGGTVRFYEPDSGRLLQGFDATTVAPVRRPLIQDIWVDVDLRGPLEFRGSFPVDQTVEGSLVENSEGLGSLQGKFTNGAVSLSIHLTAGEGAFVAGTIEAVDPEAGIDREFLVLGRAQMLGLRILSISGVWYATDDLPFATGQFNLAVRRR